jgi:hypothetical protein
MSSEDTSLCKTIGSLWLSSGRFARASKCLVVVISRVAHHALHVVHSLLRPNTLSSNKNSLRCAAVTAENQKILAKKITVAFSAGLLQHILEVKLLNFNSSVRLECLAKNSSDLQSLRLAWCESKLDLRVLKLAWEDLRSSRAVPEKVTKSRSHPAIRKSPWHNIAQKLDETLWYGSRISLCLCILSNKKGFWKSACFDQPAIGTTG